MVGARRLVGLVFLIILASSSTRVTWADGFLPPLSPLIPPIISPNCSLVACGVGNCSLSPGILGFECDCAHGWDRPLKDLTFLPCVIPNCTIDSSCSNATSPPSPPPQTFNFTDPCSWAPCGTGGTCRKGLGLLYECECEAGSANLFGIAMLPCYPTCSTGCGGMMLFPSTNMSEPPPGSSPPSSSPAPPGNSAHSSPSGNGNASGSGFVSVYTILQILILVSMLFIR